MGIRALGRDRAPVARGAGRVLSCHGPGSRYTGIISRRSAMSSCSNAALLAVALMLSLAACTPREGAAIVNCTKSAQLTLTPWRQCALRVDTFRGRAGGTFRSESPRYDLYS